VHGGRRAGGGRAARGAPFVYVTGKGGTNEISQFASLGSGALRPLTPANVASGEFPYDVAVSPRGTSAYAVDNLSNTAGAVSQYTLNPATGKLTPKSPAMVATAGVPSGIIAISPDGKNAYVPSGKAISWYRISPATGKLTLMPPRTVAGAGEPIGIKVAPGGRYLYITTGTQCLAPKGSKGSKCHASAEANTVSVFAISPATGALSAKPVQTVATGQNPQMITILRDLRGRGRPVAVRDQPCDRQDHPPVTGHRHRAVPRLTRRGGHPLTRAWPPNAHAIVRVRHGRRSISPAIAPGRVQARVGLGVAPARARGRHQPGDSAGGGRQLISNSLPSGSFSATA
jgi:hypothetical protein